MKGEKDGQQGPGGEGLRIEAQEEDGTAPGPEGRSRDLGKATVEEACCEVPVKMIRILLQSKGRVPLQPTELCWKHLHASRTQKGGAGISARYLR